MLRSCRRHRDLDLIFNFCLVIWIWIIMMKVGRDSIEEVCRHRYIVWTRLASNVWRWQYPDQVTCLQNHHLWVVWNTKILKTCMPISGEDNCLNARPYCVKQKALYWHSQQSSNIVKCRLHVWSKLCASCLLYHWRYQNIINESLYSNKIIFLHWQLILSNLTWQLVDDIFLELTYYPN